MKEYNIAIYIRLSMADEDTGYGKTESDSIVNQRSLINRYLDKHTELSGFHRTEFCDDGFTGTNTNRPAFTELMAEVKKGKYNLICVKDFSRFSRDYIEIGDCLECLFPFPASALFPSTTTTTAIIIRARPAAWMWSCETLFMPLTARTYL